MSKLFSNNSNQSEQSAQNLEEKPLTVAKKTTSTFGWAVLAVFILFVLSGYFIAFNYNKTIRDTPVSETSTPAPDTNQQIQQLQQEVQTLKNQKPRTIIKEVPTQQQTATDNSNSSQQSSNTDITATEINPYIIGVVEVICHGNVSIGSGSLWNFNGSYKVVTNKHVISSTDCRAYVDDYEHRKGGEYYLDTSNIKIWNNIADEAVLTITGPDDLFPQNSPLSDLFYGIGNMRKCPNDIKQGSPVEIIGYPASAMKKSSTPTGTNIQAFRSITNGIISGQDSSVQKPQGNLPNANYFISASIDSGNSGGVAISKDSGGLCFLGIPTWVSIGNYANQGIVQNINNILYTGQ